MLLKSPGFPRVRGPRRPPFTDMKNTFARATICGEVSVAPERESYGAQGKSLMRMTVVVETPGGEGADVKRHPFTFVTFDEMVMQQLEGIQRHDRVLVDATITNNQFEAENGRLYDRFDFRIWHVVRAYSRGTVQPPTPQRRQDNYGSGTYTPPRNAKEAGQLPHEEDSDIPF